VFIKNENLRACFTFSPKKFYQFILSSFSVCFPAFIRQISRYPPLKTEKHPQKQLLK
jgi:hypothetical protein